MKMKYFSRFLCKQHRLDLMLKDRLVVFLLVNFSMTLNDSQFQYLSLQNPNQFNGETTINKNLNFNSKQKKKF